MNSNRTLRFHRTMKEAQCLDDYAGRMQIRFPRTRADAGMHGPIDEDFGNGAGLILWGIVGALVLWVVLTLILGAG